MSTDLHLIGYDNILGYLDGGISAWLLAGFPMNRLSQIFPRGLMAKLEAGDYGQFLDVRTLGDWRNGHVKEARHLPVTKPRRQGIDVPRHDEVILVSGVGYRGKIAASSLKQNGFSHVHRLAGRIRGWKNAGFPVTT